MKDIDPNSAYYFINNIQSNRREVKKVDHLFNFSHQKSLKVANHIVEIIYYN